MTPIQEAVVSAFDDNEATNVNAIANYLCEARWEIDDMDQLRGVVETTINELVHANVVHAVSVCPSMFVLTQSG
ncbi:MAG: hypothetical protein F9B45_32560, partial [Phycisphaera sp. RhM]|nr:hypothetical protein [Phycisphaera sp. RhM]